MYSAAITCLTIEYTLNQDREDKKTELSAEIISAQTHHDSLTNEAVKNTLQTAINDAQNIMDYKEIELVIKKNKELSKLVKELNNKHRIQRQRIQDIEQKLKEKNNYISQVELKIKEINSNSDKNNLYKTK